MRELRRNTDFNRATGGGKAIVSLYEKMAKRKKKSRGTFAFTSREGSSRRLASIWSKIKGGGRGSTAQGSARARPATGEAAHAPPHPRAPGGGARSHEPRTGQPASPAGPPHDNANSGREDGGATERSASGATWAQEAPPPPAAGPQGLPGGARVTLGGSAPPQHLAGTPGGADSQLSRGRNRPTPRSRADRKVRRDALCAGATCSAAPGTAARGRCGPLAPWGEGRRSAGTGPRAHHVARPAAPDGDKAAQPATPCNQQPGTAKGSTSPLASLLSSSL